MVTLFKRLGGTLRLDDPVVAIEVENDRVNEVRTRSSWRGEADAVATNGDVVHSYSLIEGSSRGPARVKALKRKRFSPSLFVLHLGLDGTFPDIPHHSILFGPRYKGLLTDIYDRGRLAPDPALYLHHPTATDASMAPPGCSTFYALAPVPHMGRAPIDWDKDGEAYAETILDTLEERLMPDIRSRIRTRFHYAPSDFGRDLGAHLGSAFSLEPILTQSAWFRTHNRDDVIHNLYFVGAGTHPGAGIPGVVGSAEATAGLMLA
jgi:phytoene desaturase